MARSRHGLQSHRLRQRKTVTVLAVVTLLTSSARLKWSHCPRRQLIPGLLMNGSRLRVVEPAEGHFVRTVGETVLSPAQPHSLHLTLLGLALQLVASFALMKQLVNRLHVRVNCQSLLLHVTVELLDGAVERESVDEPLLSQVLSEAQGALAGDGVSVEFDEVDECLEHFAL